MVVPLDGSRATASALRPVTRLARRLGASVDVVYVVTTGGGEDGRGSMRGPRYVDQTQHEWKQWTLELAERLMVDCAGFARDVHIGVHVREGDPGAEIVRFAREGAYDAIVLVRRSRLEPERAQTLRTVIRDATCPLFVVGGEE
jgi:nucleotide-binding universal stress UspA family protein